MTEATGVPIAVPAASAVPAKPGYKTTEWYLSLAAAAVSLLFASGFLTGHELALQVAGLAASALTAAGYSVSRGLAKSGS